MSSAMPLEAQDLFSPGQQSWSDVVDFDSEQSNKSGLAIWIDGPPAVSDCSVFRYAGVQCLQQPSDIPIDCSG